MNNQQKLPSFWAFLWISLVLVTIGWGGLIILVFMTLPTIGPRWLFFFLFTLAISGTALPVTYFLNRRFPADPPVDGGVVLREGIWCGVYASLLAWLQIGGVLTPGLAVVLAMGLVLVEFLLRLSERSQWQPASPVPQADPTTGAETLAEDDDEDEWGEDE